ncbi:MAG: ribose 5-phosphate isomerase B [Spirochaetes bacterium]|nr:ribose 5-phosphate isomerase B [Spirochaetota bacterium]
MKIGISSDHGGFRLKESIKKHFSAIEFDDAGTHSEDSCDYPDYAAALCRKIQGGELEYGIIICGTGIGVSMAANKMKGIRAALCCNEFMAEMAKRHNNANVLCLGARVLGDELAFRIVDRWLNTAFDGGRHQLRVEKINGLEEA